MQFLQVTTNLINRIAGRKQEFDELLASGDISQIRSKMRTNGRAADSAMREYDTATHEVMSRKDKILTDKKGNRRGVQHLWKLPIPYQAYINEIALVFLYGRPVKWTQVSEGTDEAFAKFLDVIKRTRFNSKIRQCYEDTAALYARRNDTETHFFIVCRCRRFLDVESRYLVEDAHQRTRSRQRDA